MAARREVCQGRAELRPCHSIPLPMTHIGPYLHTFDIIRTHAPGPHNNVAVPERSVMVCATMLLVAATEDPQGTRVLNLFARDCPIWKLNISP